MNNHKPDFRLVKPIKKYSEFYNETVYVVPCNIISLTNIRRANMYKIELEVVNFKTGKLVVIPGYTYKGTLEIFKDLEVSPPFETTAQVRKFVDGKIMFVVYGLFSAGLIEEIYDVSEILNNDEDEIMNVFHSHYKEINEWIKQR